MGINETGRTGPLLPNTPVTRLDAQPVAAPVDVPAADAPSQAPQDGGHGDSNVNRLRAAGAAPQSSAMPWDAVKAAKTATETFTNQLASEKQWQSRATVAASTLAVANAIGKGNKALTQIEQGHTVSGLASLAAAGADGSSAALNGIDALRGTKDFKRLGLELKISGNVAGSISGVANGVEEIKHGDTLAGATHIAGAVSGGVSAGLSVAGMLAHEGSAVSKAAGKLAAPLGVIGGMADGVVGIERGVEQMMHGHVLEGLGTAGKGALDAASSGSYLASVIPTGSAALTTFGKAAGPLGAAAGAVGGGIQVYQALHSHPPDVEKAVLGGAKAAGSALLMAPPPGNIAGGAVLIGAALYENRAAIGHAAVAVGHAVAHEAEHVAHALAHEASHVAHEVAHEASHVAHEVADGAKHAAQSIGHFFSSLW